MPAKNEDLHGTGLAADRCVLLTASDASVHVVVPADGVASVAAEDAVKALTRMRKILDADVRASTTLDLEALKRGVSAGG